MKNPAEILKEEHHAVLGKLATLEGLVNDLEQPEKVSAKLKELAAFFDTEFWVHFDKEERALFPEFDGFMPRGAGPLAAMIDEHGVIRNTNEVLQESVSSYLNGDLSAETKKTLKQSGMHFIQYLRAHISKEDGLFPRLAEMHLGPMQFERVVNRFSEIEKASNK